MKNIVLLLQGVLLTTLIGCQGKQSSVKSGEFDRVSKVASGKAVSVMLTSYSTTLRANGTDTTTLRIALTDSLSREITSATDTVHIFVWGGAHVHPYRGQMEPSVADTSGAMVYTTKLERGVSFLTLTMGQQPGKVKVEARSGTCWPGAHEIHALPASFEMRQPADSQLQATVLPPLFMMGADISFLPQLEAHGRSFSENDSLIDALVLLKKHGFNTIRLRIFVNPEQPKGYAPVDGFCDLNYTLQMAKRIKQAGMNFLLDFHYSDYWADPQQQFKLARWEQASVSALADSVHHYTFQVLSALQVQGTTPDMVQIGNEINHGILWPEGHISHPDTLALLLKSGISAARKFNPALPIMLHLALGGQHTESVFWLDNMLARGVTFDVIGISYYPRWHGTLYDLKYNLTHLAERYQKPINVVEYSDFKREVHHITFNLPNHLGTGACIWEPLNHRSGLFDRQGRATVLFREYDLISGTYLKKEK